MSSPERDSQISLLIWHLLRLLVGFSAVLVHIFVLGGYEVHEDELRTDFYMLQVRKS